jgi:hypothetical protein
MLSMIATAGRMSRHPPVWHPDVSPLVRAGGVAVGLAALSAAVLWFVLPLPTVSVNVRWQENVAEAERGALESQFNLTRGRALEGTTWQYELLDYSRDNIRALVEHPTVEDTHRLDRALYQPSEPPVPRNWQVAGGALLAGALGLLLLLAFRLRARLLAMQPTRAVRAGVPTTSTIVTLAGLTMVCWSFLFAPTYTLAFHWDDLHFVRPYSLSELASTFHGPNDPDRIETVALRPVATLLFCLQGVVLGEHIVLQRLFMAVLMGGLLVVVGLLLRETGLSMPHIAIVFALFASSRVFASLVLWITIGTVILSYIFSILSALCYLRWIERRGRRLLLLTLGLAALSVCTREEAYALPMALPLLWVLAHGSHRWRRALAGATAVGAVMAVHFLLRGIFLPNAPRIHVSLVTLTEDFWPALQSAWLPGGLRAEGSVDLWLRGLWQWFLGALILIFAFVGRGRTHLVVLGVCVLALILSTPSLGVARSFGIALPSLALYSAMALAIVEVRGVLLPPGLGQRVWRPALSTLLALGLALGIGAGIRRSWYVVEALQEHAVERVVRDGSFLFDTYGRPATIPARRREAGLERLAAAGIRSREDLEWLRGIRFNDNAPSILQRLGSPLFINKYDYMSF